MTNDNIVPIGSTAKAFTAVGIMQLVEQGKLALNDTIDQHVDEILMKNNATTLSQIWNNDPKISEVTVYQLLHMKSGMYDYDDEEMK